MKPLCNVHVPFEFLVQVAPLLPVSLPAVVDLASSTWWINYLGLCHPHRIPELGFWFMALAWSSSSGWRHLGHKPGSRRFSLSFSHSVFCKRLRRKRLASFFTCLLSVLLIIPNYLNVQIITSEDVVPLCANLMCICIRYESTRRQKSNLKSFYFKAPVKNMLISWTKHWWKNSAGIVVAFTTAVENESR